jgi:toxin ParE1/3/4
LGIEFFDAVDATIDQIVAMPRAGSRVRRLPPDLTVRRRPVTRFPYHVVYLELTTHIRILAIAHDRRKPGYWKDRLE